MSSIIGNRMMAGVGNLCGLVLALGICRLGQATDIVSPANVNATNSTPFVGLNKVDGMSNPLYQWTLEGDEIEFSIRDLSGSQFPLQINAGALSNSIRIGNDRNVGFGTSTPQRNLHIADIDDPPTLRFESTAQSWDLEADGLGFDLVNKPGLGGESRPFTVLPDAPTASLFVATNGDIGMGTIEPNKILSKVVGGRILNVRSATSMAQFVGQGPLGSHLNLVDTSAAANRKIFRLRVRSNLAYFEVPKDDFSAYTVPNAIVVDMGNGNIGMGIVPEAGKALKMKSGAHCTAGGVWTSVSSRELKQDIAPITSEQAQETVRALQPVGYRYKNEPDEKYVGFVAEDVPELVATNDRKSLAPMDIVAVLTRVVQDQDRQLQDQNRQLGEQRVINKALMERLAKLEQRLTE